MFMYHTSVAMATDWSSFPFHRTCLRKVLKFFHPAGVRSNLDKGYHQHAHMLSSALHAVPMPCPCSRGMNRKK